MFYIIDTLLQKRGENIATPSRYIFVFDHEVLNKNYINISDIEYNKFALDTLRTQISPWNIPSPLASKYLAGLSNI